MRKIVPSTPSSNKESRNRRASLTATPLPSEDVTPTASTIRIKTVMTSQSANKPATDNKYGISHKSTKIVRSASNAVSFAARKLPDNTKEKQQCSTTPADIGDIAQGQVKKLIKAISTPYRSTPTTSQPSKSGAIKRKIATPSDPQSVYKSSTTPVTSKLAVISESMRQKATNAVQKLEQKEDESHVTVAVRVRPLNQRERAENGLAVVETEEEGLVTVTNADNSRTTYQYDHCFGPSATQIDIFRTLVYPLSVKALEGYNACLFSYGQTGSGKTYSMMGVDSTELVNKNRVGRDAGIIPRFGFSLFECLIQGREVQVEISYFEIYNEKIRDLLVDDSIKGLKPAPLQVREHPQQGFYVEGLTSHSVATYEQLLDWLQLGLKKRAIAASAMNDKSSRSHCIFSVTLTQRKDGVTRRSKVHLVDLAGSERLVNTCATGERLKEGVSINVSLLTLGKVITALTEKQSYIPYRESLLTRLLSDSLGGSARTVMLATVGPSRMYVEETLATLRYACQARAIVNRPQLQQTSMSTQQLKEEWERLRLAREEYEQHGMGRELIALQAELAAVKQQLEFEKERSSTWKSRVNDSELACAHQKSELTKRGVAECSEMAGLRLLTPDPFLSLLFALPGPTCPRKVLGRQQPPADIELQGALIAEEHCALEWRNGTVWLVPIDPSAECYVNGALVDVDAPLANGDRLALGGEFFLLVQLEPGIVSAKDHEFARMELSLAQNTRLNHELTQAKERAIIQLEQLKEQMDQIGADKQAAETELEIFRREQKQLVQTLQTEVFEGRKRMEMAQSNLDISLVPFTSNLLQELHEVGFVDAGAGLGLHEMRCLVREASQRCQRLGLSYRFSQVQQVLKELQPGKSALQPCVRVRKQDQVATCSPNTFLAILNALRDNENEEQDVTSVLNLLRALEWETEEEPRHAETSLEASVSVDVTSFKRHLLSLSLTYHEEEDEIEGESKNSVETCISALHETLSKLQKIMSCQSHIQPYLQNIKTSICQFERAALHPNLESFQHSESSDPSVIEWDQSRSNSQKSNIESLPMASLDEALDRLRQSEISAEPSSSSTISSVMHSPPSISAQPVKPTLRGVSLPGEIASPSKQVHFKIRNKSSKH